MVQFALQMRSLWIHEVVKTNVVRRNQVQRKPMFLTIDFRIIGRGKGRVKIDMSRRQISQVVALLALGFSFSARAGSLQVSPVGLEMQSPAATATMTLRNSGSEPINAQVRIFRWTQESGQDQLLPTDSVVASPPMTTLTPGVDYTIRVIRTAQAAVTTPEAYRLIVDEIPNRRMTQSRTVELVVRYSIPVFFYPRNSADAKLEWSLEKVGGQTYVKATNTGDQHIRLANMSVRTAGDRSVSIGRGLVGYVLGNSTMRWPAPVGIDSSVSILAQTNLGPIKASSIGRTSH